VAYASREDMEARFGEREVIALTDRQGSGAVNEAVLSEALEAADDEINGYLRGRYGLPLPTVPRLITRLACDIARYRLCGAEVTETEPVRNRYKDAVKLLESIAAGKISLGLDESGSVAPEPSGVGISTGPRTFTDETLGDYS
jgi:phage gp36-like protein